MVTSCFFCQNLLSDFIEGILPSSRYEQIKEHLSHCSACDRLHKDLNLSLSFLHTLPTPGLKPELALRVVEAAEAGRSYGFNKVKFSKKALYFSAPLLIIFAVMMVFPQVFPWMTYLRNREDSSHFVRYFPLLQGAAEVIDEQASWLHMREPMVGSLWEEGGLSPEEFEKTFQKKTGK